MINLLPDDSKKEIRAARMNVILIRYNLITLSALLLLLGFCLVFYVIMHKNQSDAQLTSSDNTVRAASYAKVRSAADDYRNNLTLASKILAGSVSYTNVIFEITKLLPPGVVLDGITLSESDFGSQTAFSAHAKGYDQATALKENFQKSKLFTNVYFQNLADGSAAGGNAPANPYPIAVSISAKLNKVAP